MRRLIVLRPEPGASATVGRARERALNAVAIPLFEVQALPWNAPDPERFDGLLLTSANAVLHGGKRLLDLRALPVYAVGAATAAEARSAGFEVSLTGDGGVDRLLSSIPHTLRLLHLCGEHRRTPGASRAAITPIVVYRSVPVEAPDLSPAGNAVALIHSPRAGHRFSELVKDRGSIIIAAISATAAGAVGGGWAAVEVAEEPNDQALLALAARLCNKPGAE